LKPCAVIFTEFEKTLKGSPLLKYLFRQGLWCFFLLWAFPALGMISTNVAGWLSLVWVVVIANGSICCTTLVAQVILSKIHERRVFDNLEIVIDLPIIALFSSVSLALDSILTSLELVSLWRTLVAGLFLALVTLAEPFDS
jgi:hypothetical protein